MKSYRIDIGRGGNAVVTNGAGDLVWERESGTAMAIPEVVCDALVEAISWTAQHHTGHLILQVADAHIAHELLCARALGPDSRLASMIDEARVLMTWFESTDVVLRDADVDALVA